MEKEGWQDIEIPKMFRLQYPAENKFRYVWLKGEFEIDNPDKYYGISFGRIYHIFNIFLNNRLLDYKPETEIENLHQPVHYVLPSGSLISGKNTVYIRLGIFGVEYGGIPDGIYIHNRHDFKKKKNWQEFIFSLIPLSIILIMLLGAVRLFINYIMERQEMFFLYTSIMLAIEAFYIFTIYSKFKDMGFGSILYVLAMSGPLFGIFFILIIQSIYRVKLHEHNRIIFPTIILSSVIAIIIKEKTFNFYLIPATGLFAIVAFILYATYLIYRLNKIKPDRVKFTGLIILVNLIAVGAALEVYFYITGNALSLIVNAYVSPAMILGFAVLGNRDFQRRIIDLRVLYDELKRKKISSKKNISNFTEDKIKAAIEFINENYKSEIFRKDIAEAVGMNSNYFSGKFREYTGKKINDYINEQRVREAAEFLKDRDVRIVDVAFSTGFDSLATFNRCFKAVMNKTPTEYRNDL